MNYSNYCNLIGLFLDILGVTMLFCSRLRDIPIEIEQYEEEAIGSGTLPIKIATAIKETNRLNKIAYRKSLVWFIFILLGFLFQFAANLSILTGSTNDKHHHHYCSHHKHK